MRESWTDERLDDLNGRVSDGFRRVDERFARVDEQFRQVDDRFDRLESKIEHIDGRIDTMQRTMLQGVIGLCTVFAGGFAAVLTLIATQL